MLRYLPGEHYTAHHDFFDPGEYTGDNRERGYATNRFATIFFYLNEVEAGGETGTPHVWQESSRPPACLGADGHMRALLCLSAPYKPSARRAPWGPHGSPVP